MGLQRGIKVGAAQQVHKNQILLAKFYLLLSELNASWRAGDT